METTQLIPASPRRHFGFSQCSGCVDTPCMMLRGENRSGSRYVFVHRRNYGYADCPLAVRSEHDLRWYLQSLGSMRLQFDYVTILNLLDAIELRNYNQNDFLYGHSDNAGRINYIMFLYQHKIITAVGVPFNWQSDTKMRQWFFVDASTIVFPGEVHREQQEEEPDAAESDATTNLSITNPRWEHVNQNTKKSSPDRTRTGDIVKLMADTRNAPAGATVTFRICDTSAQPPREIDVVDGSVENNTATAQWTVDLDTSGAPKIEFEARCQGRTTKMVEIGVVKREFEFSC
jgi:hypothetical protein